MVMALEAKREVAERPAGGADELARSVTAAVLTKRAATFVVEADSVSRVTEVMSPVRLLMLMMGRAAGRVSATISPRFSEATYPALLDLIGRLNDAGAADLWQPDGARTVAVGPARHVFVSADMPVVEQSARPDCLLEVVEAHRISASWYRSRVARRLTPGLVRVFFGQGGVPGSAFEMAQAEALAEEAFTGSARRFSLDA